MTVTKHDAIKQLSNAIAYAKVREETWADNIYVPALEIAVRAMVKERKKGWWDEFVPGLYRCSECGKFSPTQENFCPTCGADMREKNQ